MNWIQVNWAALRQTRIFLERDSTRPPRPPFPPNQTKCFVAFSFSPKIEMVRKFGHRGESGGPRREAADAPQLQRLAAAASRPFPPNQKKFFVAFSPKNEVARKSALRGWCRAQDPHEHRLLRHADSSTCSHESTERSSRNTREKQRGQATEGEHCLKHEGSAPWTQPSMPQCPALHPGFISS